MPLPPIFGEYRLVTDVELRFSPGGVAIATGRMAANSRKKDESGDWVDDKVCWLKFIAFKNLAENMAESLTKGSLCLISGRLQTEEWEVKEGENKGQKRQSYEVVVDNAGPSLAFKAARILDTPTRENQSDSPTAPAEDPWGTPPQPDEAPPF